MNPDYWRGFNAGMKEAEKKASMAAAQVLAFYIESLKNVPGIGPKTYQRIVQHINTIDVGKGGVKENGRNRNHD